MSSTEAGMKALDDSGRKWIKDLSPEQMAASLNARLNERNEARAERDALRASHAELVRALENVMVHEHAAAYALASRPETEASFKGACEHARTALRKAQP